MLFVDNGRVLTSAGAAAGIDMCLYLVRRDYGAQIANATARHCVVAPWRDGGQAQFIEHAVPLVSDSSTSATRQWALGFHVRAHRRPARRQPTLTTHIEKETPT
ncbi:MAG: hypothetical protein ACRDSH_18695 [Pseudonocardiaceae bacterium]